MPSSTFSLPLAVSIGEPAGIGPDVALIAQHQATTGIIPPLPPFVLLADPEHLMRRAEDLNLSIALKTLKHIEDFDPENHQDLMLLPLDNSLQGLPSQPHQNDAAGIVEAITKGVSLIQKGMVRGLVTLPINKKSLYDAGFDYPGHTEFLGALAEQWPHVKKPVRPVMMLAGPSLRAVPVTIHIPLMAITQHLTQQLIEETILITDHGLRTQFAIEKPRIAVSGLNPHAGEEGAMGHEDAQLITPTISRLQAKGVDCFGPLPADTMFHPAARARYDAAVCMYHDQALIPAKALAFDESVNVTLGLPFIRTSPDHGTAFDIAGTGKANPSSTLAALRLADRMSVSQQDKTL